MKNKARMKSYEAIDGTHYFEVQYTFSFGLSWNLYGAGYSYERAKTIIDTLTLSDYRDHYKKEVEEFIKLQGITKTLKH